MLRSDGRRRGRLAAGERRERKRLPAAALASGVGIGFRWLVRLSLPPATLGEDGREDQEGWDHGSRNKFSTAFLLPVDLESRLIGDEDQVTDAWGRGRRKRI